MTDTQQISPSHSEAADVRKGIKDDLDNALAGIGGTIETDVTNLVHAAVQTTASAPRAEVLVGLKQVERHISKLHKRFLATKK